MEWRKFRHLTQERAAERIGIEQATLSRIERGVHPYNQDFLEVAASVYGCEPADLIAVAPIPQKVGHFIREWRKYRGLTLEQLAERVDLSHGALSQLERGVINYTQPTLEALASALNCEPADLLTGDPKEVEA